MMERWRTPFLHDTSTIACIAAPVIVRNLSVLGSPRRWSGGNTLHSRGGWWLEKKTQNKEHSFAAVSGFVFFSNQFTMKLRDRQKRVSNDIKQEDKKAAINLIDTPSSTFNESSAYSFNIKQEDTKNDNNLLQQDGKSTGLSIVSTL
ncbi:hypothetical protein G6F42_024200 [Rhizopus arrhizus]|nr:hypothetical protein G6F42_024200 [Rhizopus arrhizus]